MLENWINPSSSRAYIENQITRKNSCFIEQASFKRENIFSPVALIGAGNNIDLIRAAFYNLDFTSFNKLSITDLGDVRNNDPSLMTAAYQELISEGIFPIVIDAASNTSIAIGNALKASAIENYQGIISPRTDIKFETFSLLSSLLEDDKVHFLSLIGYQKHYANPANQSIPHLDMANMISLGKLRDDFSGIEPILRDLTSLHFNTSVIRSSDSSGLKNQSSIGLTSEEACKLMSYACSSGKIKSLHISGFDFEAEPKMAAELIACLIWYALGGRQNVEDEPKNTIHMDKHIVELSMIDGELQFWKNQNSERWWVEIPNSQSKNNLVPCSENEYKLACNNQISNRLFLLLTNR